MKYDEQLEEIKKVELNILKEFIIICEKLGLKYYLIGGTLLGAIRHNGFIPWDDDIDVGMPRSDYEVFLNKAQDLLPENLFLQNIYTEKQYLLCFAKIRNSDTTFLESAVSDFNINHGVYIDVFPLDYYPENLGGKFKVEKVKWYSRRIECRFNLKRNRSIYNITKRFVLKMLMPSIDNVKWKRDQIYKSFTESDLIANYGGAWGSKEIVPAEWYGKGTEVVFEGLKVMAPLEYDKWLRQVYGDYMTFPPIEKRITHHYTEIIDLKKSYKYYLDK